MRVGSGRAIGGGGGSVGFCPVLAVYLGGGCFPGLAQYAFPGQRYVAEQVFFLRSGFRWPWRGRKLALSELVPSCFPSPGCLRAPQPLRLLVP